VIVATFTIAGGPPRLGAVRRNEGTLVDLADAYLASAGRVPFAFTDMLEFIRSGEAGKEAAATLLSRTPPDAASVHRLSDVTLLAPVTQPPQMRDFSVFENHMRNAGAAMARLRSKRTGSKDPLPTPQDIELPEAFYRQPLYYKANRFAVVGHEHEVRWPHYAQLFDYELEFGIFISRGGANISAAKARDHIFGYTIFNDFSARDAQEFEMSAPFGPAKGKDFDTGNALGPWIVTADEIPDPYALTMIARVNGEEWSRGSSRDMVHRFEDMIAHVSRDETLHPGEFLGSGTVGGGSGLELDRWLQHGDVVELEVEGIGVLRNRVVRSQAV
jgi:2-keto-4-pentenoate hydratase/2-oxohepta-3-ene-1,7-dioic acid hydratase in catechol pathway